MTDGLVLIDTSVWILALRRRADEKTKGLVSRILDQDRAATCGLISVELLGGARTRKEYEALSKDLEALHYLPTPEPTWRKVSLLCLRLRAKGISIPYTDLLIAQIAMDNGCTLLHSDSHFNLIARHTNLHAQNAPK